VKRLSHRTSRSCHQPSIVAANSFAGGPSRRSGRGTDESRFSVAAIGRSDVAVAVIGRGAPDVASGRRRAVFDGGDQHAPEPRPGNARHATARRRLAVAAVFAPVRDDYLREAVASDRAQFVAASSIAAGCAGFR
jgi:hypothetical protein